MAASFVKIPPRKVATAASVPRVASVVRADLVATPTARCMARAATEAQREMGPTEAMAAGAAEVATEVRAAMEEMVAMGSGVVFMSLVEHSKFSPVLSTPIWL